MTDPPIVHGPAPDMAPAVTASLPEIVALATVIAFVPRIPPPAAVAGRAGVELREVAGERRESHHVVAVDAGGTAIPPPPDDSPVPSPVTVLPEIVERRTANVPPALASPAP